MNSRNSSSNIVKYLIIFLVLIGFVGMIVANHAYAVCAPEYLEPGEPCVDGFTTLIIEPHEAQIENLDGKLFHVIGPFTLEQESDDRIRLDGVTFTHPSYPNPPMPGGPVSVTITFESGAKERIFKIGAPSPFVEFVGVDPQAGVRRNADGSFDFLLSAKQQLVSPLKQFKSGIAIDDIQCKESLTLVTRHDGSPACVSPVTKQHLMDRNWTETKSLVEIENNSDSIKQNIVRIEDGHISLYPENMCASLTLDLPTEEDIQRYTNDARGLKDDIILQITDEDLKEIPYMRELIYAVHSIEFPYNEYSSAHLDGLTFVEYEFFLMESAIKKYGDLQGDYFIRFDNDYENRFTNPVKQGFTNHFEAPVIIYNDAAYSVSGTNFWTSDEHNPRRMSIFPINSIELDEKFITLTDDDMKSIPKIKEAIENIGTIEESISAHKGLPEDEWNEYREWFAQKSLNQLGSDSFRLMEYKNQLYSIGFSIC